MSGRTAIVLTAFLGVAVAEDARVPLASAQSEVRGESKPDCTKIHGRSGAVEMPVYTNMGSDPQLERWEVHPCGQTMRRDLTLPGAVEALPCRTSPEYRCFESAVWKENRSNVFFAIPRSYAGGNARWSVEGVEFAASVVSSPGSDDTVVITALRRQGEVMPPKQTFIFSVRNGLLAAIIGDGLAPDTRTYVLASRKGLFASAETR
jgi:hypothetical protein